MIDVLKSLLTERGRNAKQNTGLLLSVLIVLAVGDVRERVARLESQVAHIGTRASAKTNFQTATEPGQAHGVEVAAGAFKR